MSSCINFGSDGTHLIGSYSAILKSQKVMEDNHPPPSSLSFPKKYLDQNFKRSILFSLVGKSCNYVFGDVNLPTTLRKRAVS